jgi:hypothetical protein
MITSPVAASYTYPAGHDPSASNGNDELTMAPWKRREAARKG